MNFNAPHPKHLLIPTLVLALALGLLAGRARPAASAPAANIYYLAPDGDDANDGSLAHPWATLEYALTQLSAGDTLQLRQGTYREDHLTVDLHGTPAAPIVIESYPGERAQIDGGIEDFLTAPNARWELVDANISLYRSIDTFSGSFVGAWLLDDDIRLVTYDVAANLESTNYGPVNGYDPIYQGPGIQLRDDGHLYIRLTQNPNDLIDPNGDPIDPIPADVDPNHNAISVFFSSVLFYLDGAEYVQFRDLDFAHAKYIFDIRNASNHITFEGCTLDSGGYGMVVRDAHDFDIRDCEFNSGLPDYVYWTDVKNGAYETAEAYPEHQSKALTGNLSGFDIRGCLFRNSMDGVGVMDGSVGVSIIGNRFLVMRDDALDLRPGIADVEIAHNLLWKVGSGVSMTETDADPLGHVYIHHNIIDTSIYQHGGREGNYREANWPTWTVLDPFGSHGEDEAAWWKVYNNTCVGRKSGYENAPAGPHAIAGNPEKYVENNIFLMLDDRTIFRGDHASTGAHYDGDVFHRLASGPKPLFRDFGDGGDYDTLAQFRSQSGTDWEMTGLEEDPELDMTAITGAVYDAPTMWQRYTPANLHMFTQGASYQGLGWPETGHDFYRGAVAPLHLWAAPDAAALHITWELTATLPVTATWRISYAGPAGDAPSPIDGIPLDDRGRSLTGLTNGATYTVTLNAMLAGSPVITDVVSAQPASPPPLAPALALTPVDVTTLRLSWQRASGDLRYQVWRSETPYFDLSGPGAGRVDAAPWQWDDASALGDPAVNHYYRVIALRSDGAATISGRVGEFDFGLTPGGP